MLWLSLALALTMGGPPPGAAKRSVSVGSPGHGHLIRGKRLTLKSRSHRVIGLTISRGFYWGTEELTRLIPRLSRGVARRFRGARLAVGNLSRQRGGDIPQSVTHNSGRDVDLLFYATNLKGKPVVRTNFLRFGKDGLSRDGKLKFDVARNWALVRTAVTQKKIPVQSMLCASWLERMLIAHAKKIREKKWIIGRAKQVLRQPGRSSPHDDHFHLRVYCALHERLNGCVNRGPMHNWVDDLEDEIAVFAKQYVQQIDDKKTKTAVEAIRRLGKMRARSATKRLLKALEDKRLEVRLAAVTALEELHALDSNLSVLVAAAQAATAGMFRLRLLKILARKAHPAAKKLFRAVAVDVDARSDSRAVAAEGSAATRDRDAVAGLIQCVTSQESVIRNAATRALSRLTGQTMTNQDGWNAWWKKNARKKRAEWLADTFEDTLDMKLTATTCRKFIGKLLPRVYRKRGAVSENAKDLIEALTGFRRDHRRKKRLKRLYRGWLKKGGARSCKKRVKGIRTKRSTKTQAAR